MLLALPGPAFPAFDFSPVGAASVAAAEPAPAPRFTVCGTPVVLTADQHAADAVAHTVHTAASLWDCSLVLAKYLEHAVARIPALLARPRLLELGAAGLLGALAGHH